MAIGAGHSKTVTDGLIFGYDTGDKRNSFKGKDTTNLLTNIGYNYGTQDSALFKTNYGTETVNIPAIGEVTTHYVNIYNDYNGGSGQCCLSLFGFGNCAVSPSTVYTYQIIYKTTTGYSNPNYMYHYEYGPGGYVTEYGLHSTSREVDLGDGWKMGWGTFTTNASTNNTTCYLFHYEYGTYNKVQLAGIMLTQGSVVYDPLHFLPVQGTRSSANSLKNLVPNVIAATTSTVSYTVEPTVGGNITFDGSDDYLDLGQDVLISDTNQGWTAEYVFKTNSAGTLQHFNSAEADDFNANWLALYNSNLAVWNVDPGYWKYGDTVFSSNRYYHVAFVCDPGGTNYRFYVNGIREGGDHVGNSWVAGYSKFISRYIGRYEYNGSYDRYFGGEIPVAKMYNRALTDTELAGNYLHYASRYNMTEYRYSEGSDASKFLGNWNNSTTYTMADFGGLGSVTAHGWSNGPATYTLTLQNIPSHTQVRYRVFWHLVDSLDNETNRLYIGNGSSETEILTFTKQYNLVPNVSYLASETFAPWSGPKTYSYRPWANGAYNQDGYLLVDSGWKSHTSSTFTAKHIMGADQVQADEAMYLSHVEVLFRY